MNNSVLQMTSINSEVMSLLKEKVNNMRSYIKEIVPDRSDEISNIDFNEQDINKYFSLFLLTGMNASHIYDIIKRKFSISNDDEKLKQYCQCVYEILTSCVH